MNNQLKVITNIWKCDKVSNFSHSCSSNRLRSIWYLKSCWFIISVIINIDPNDVVSIFWWDGHIKIFDGSLSRVFRNFHSKFIRVVWDNALEFISFITKVKIFCWVSNVNSLNFVDHQWSSFRRNFIFFNEVDLNSVLHFCSNDDWKLVLIDVDTTIEISIFKCVINDFDCIDFVIWMWLIVSSCAPHVLEIKSDCSLWVSEFVILNDLFFMHSIC